jgi:hypothetical protein
MKTPTAAERAAAAAIFGHMGGKSKSPKKIAAVKRNGKKGGRPKKKR